MPDDRYRRAVRMSAEHWRLARDFAAVHGTTVNLELRNALLLRAAGASKQERDAIRRLHQQQPGQVPA